MKGMVRTVLVDPLEESRQELRGLLGGISTIWLAEVVAGYQDAAQAVARLDPDLLIVGVDAAPDAAVALIQEVVRTRPGVAVLPTSSVRDSSVIIETFRAGAREFLTLPAAPEKVLEAVERLVRAGPESLVGARADAQVLAVLGAAGGVGCTTLAVNLASALAKDAANEVALVDLDLYLGAVDVCLDIGAERTLIDVVRSLDRLDLPLLKRSLTRHASGVYVLPRPASMEDAAGIDPEALRRILEMLRSVFPTILLDMSKGFQPSDSLAMELADTILLVVHLEPACLRNTARLIDTLGQFEGLREKLRVVVNRVGASDCEVGVKKAQEILKVSAAWQIPYAPKVFDPARVQGTPIDSLASGCRAHRAILDIARGFAHAPLDAGRGKSRFGRIAASFF